MVLLSGPVQHTLMRRIRLRFERRAGEPSLGKSPLLGLRERLAPWKRLPGERDRDHLISLGHEDERVAFFYSGWTGADGDRRSPSTSAE